MKKLRVGIIGLGVGLKHIDGYKRSGCAITMLCDVSTAKLKEAHRHLPAIRSTRMAHDICSNPGIDIVSIASYDDAHYQQVMNALQYGKHVFVEKPLCQNWVQLKEIYAMWKKKKGRVILMSNLILRAAPLYLWLKHEIRKGAFGKIYAFDGDYLYGRIEKITSGWRKNVKNYSVMQGGGIHLIDLMLWLTGERPCSVISAGNNISTKGTSFRYNDYVASTFMFRSGLVARITANFGCVHKHQHVIRIFGTKRTFIYDDQGPRIYSNRNPAQPPRKIRLAALASSKADLIPEFVSSISKQKNMNPNIQTIFDGVSLSIAANRALAIQSQVTIQYP